MGHSMVNLTSTMGLFVDWAVFSGSTGAAALLGTVVLWSLLWKGLALWHSARRSQVWWFLAILLINTVGILEIAYLFGFAKLRRTDLFPTRAA